MKKMLSLALAATMTLSLVACGGADNTATTAAAGGENSNVEENVEPGAESSDSTVHRDQLVVAISREPKTLVPYASNDTGTSPITHQMYEALIGLDENMEKVPGLATEWEKVDDTHYRFKLREGVTFHNGNPFTAEDVVYSFAQSSTGEATKETIGPVDIENCVIEDDYTVVIALKEAYPAFLNCCTLDIAAIVDKETMEADPEGYLANPVGTGPFKFVEWATGDYIKLEANDEWWGGDINFDSLLLRYIPEGSTRAIEAESGGVDIAHITVSDAGNAESSPETNLQVSNILNTSYVSFNCSIEPFNNEKVRQAIALALNNEAIVEANYLGYGKVSQSFLAPDIWGYADVEGAYEGYDVEQAKALMAEAGYADGFSCTLVSNGGQTVAEMIQAQLKEIGIEVTLNVTDFATWLDTIINGRQQMYVGGWTVPSADATEAFAAFHSENMGPTNRSFYGNPDSDELIEVINTETDEAKRMEACVALQEILAEDCVTIPLNVGVAFYSVNKTVDGFYCLPTQSPEFAYIKFTE